MTSLLIICFLTRAKRPCIWQTCTAPRGSRGPRLCACCVSQSSRYCCSLCILEIEYPSVGRACSSSSLIRVARCDGVIGRTHTHARTHTHTRCGSLLSDLLSDWACVSRHSPTSIGRGISASKDCTSSPPSWTDLRMAAITAYCNLGGARCAGTRAHPVSSVVNYRVWAVWGTNVVLHNTSIQ